MIGTRPNLNGVPPPLGPCNSVETFVAIPRVLKECHYRRLAASSANIRETGVFSIAAIMLADILY
jgi:hypothetical protein